MLFPLAEYWWFYAVFTAFVLVLLAVDLGVFHRKDHEITIREAAKFSAIWISMAMLFNVLLYYYAQSAFSQDPRLLALTRRRRRGKWPSNFLPATSWNTRCRLTTCSCSS